MTQKPRQWLKSGDSVAIEIEKVGALTNPATEEELR
jgi:2-keto-4-pentenoate hydratase/2-oxohepta-3-ene-1,7-dioic acid hydratase in catechol pathway